MINCPIPGCGYRMRKRDGGHGPYWCAMCGYQFQPKPMNGKAKPNHWLVMARRREV